MPYTKVAKKCNSKKSGTLNPHHIKNFKKYLELRFDVDNGIVFCKKCHQIFHKKYGYKDNNLEQVIEFILKK